MAGAVFSPLAKQLSSGFGQTEACSARRLAEASSQRRSPSRLPGGTRKSRFHGDRRRALSYFAAINATVASSIRLLKPHSLSYQLETLTSRPETFVSVASKIDERASWLKSLETSGSAL